MTSTNMFSNNEIQNERKDFDTWWKLQITIFRNQMGEIAWVGFSANDQSLEYWHVMFCADGIKLFIQKSCIIL